MISIFKTPIFFQIVLILLHFSIFFNLQIFFDFQFLFYLFIFLKS